MLHPRMKRKNGMDCMGDEETTGNLESASALPSYRIPFPFGPVNRYAYEPSHAYRQQQVMV